MRVVHYGAMCMNGADKAEQVFCLFPCFALPCGFANLFVRGDRGGWLHVVVPPSMKGARRLGVCAGEWRALSSLDSRRDNTPSALVSVTTHQGTILLLIFAHFGGAMEGKGKGNVLCCVADECGGAGCMLYYVRLLHLMIHVLCT